MKILHVMGEADIGGIISLVYTYARHMDCKRYHMDIALMDSKPGLMGHELEKIGSRFYSLPLKSRDLKGFIRELDRLLRAERYDAIHVHSNDTSWVALLVALKNGVKCRVAHAHLAQLYSVDERKQIKLCIGRCFNSLFATHLLACGRDAGNYIFGQRHMRSRKALVLPNAVDTQKFRYDSVVRLAMREELGIGDRYAIGMVSRVSYAKNHVFALQVLKQLTELDNRFMLVVVGDGALFRYVKILVAKLGLENHVIFTGARVDVERFYPALDACILPSLYEGLPVTAIESLTSGLPTIMSDFVTRELDFSDLTTYLPLELDAWVSYLANRPKGNCRATAYLEVAKNGYDINGCTSILESVYNTAE